MLVLVQPSYTGEYLQHEVGVSSHRYNLMLRVNSDPHSCLPSHMTLQQQLGCLSAEKCFTGSLTFVFRLFRSKRKTQTAKDSRASSAGRVDSAPLACKALWLFKISFLCFPSYFLQCRSSLEQIKCNKADKNSVFVGLL